MEIKAESERKEPPARTVKITFTRLGYIDSV